MNSFVPVVAGHSRSMPASQAAAALSPSSWPRSAITLNCACSMLRICQPSLKRVAMHCLVSLRGPGSVACSLKQPAGRTKHGVDAADHLLHLLVGEHVQQPAVGDGVEHLPQCGELQRITLDETCR